MPLLCTPPCFSCCYLISSLVFPHASSFLKRPPAIDARLKNEIGAPVLTGSSSLYLDFAMSSRGGGRLKCLSWASWRRFPRLTSSLVSSALANALRAALWDSSRSASSESSYCIDYVSWRPKKCSFPFSAAASLFSSIFSTVTVFLSSPLITFVSVFCTAASKRLLT